MASIHQVDLSQVTTEERVEVFAPDPDEFAACKERLRQVKAKINKGDEMTLEDQRVVIQFARMDRTQKFVLNRAKVKSPKVYAGKKLSRAKFILLQIKLDTLGLDEREQLDYIKTKAAYEGKKLSAKDLHALLVREYELEDGAELNYIDKLDKQKTENN